MKGSHKPVLLNEVLEAFDYLRSKSKIIFVDGTLGLGGHSATLALKLNDKNYLTLSNSKQKDITIVGIDKDNTAIINAKMIIQNLGLDKHFIFVNDDYNNYSKILKKINISRVNGILSDLGISSLQLEDKNRGFSFNHPGAPLDMRMNQNQVLTATTVVNSYPKQKLEKILKAGEERHYKKIAEAICKKRKNKKIKKVGDLLDILSTCIPRRKSKTHFATDTFRALRIEVNNELSRLENTIIDFVNSLKRGGRLALISFHSLEDRIIKYTFVELANPCTCPPELPKCLCGQKAKIKIITKKPIVPTKKEVTDNPRSRSAKLRIVEKL